MKTQEYSPFRVSPLRMPFDALAPCISEEAVRTHLGTHHRAYASRANALARAAGLADRTPEEIIREAHGSSNLRSLFENASQSWNHNLYWRSLCAKSRRPQGDLADAIKTDFGSFKTLTDSLIEAGSGKFGGGWVWLNRHGKGRLEVLTTSGADSPVVWGGRPLLTLDIWEHAYYLDHRHDRKRYLACLVRNHLDWAIAAEQFGSSSPSANPHSLPALARTLSGKRAKRPSPSASRGRVKR